MVGVYSTLSLVEMQRNYILNMVQECAVPPLDDKPNFKDCSPQEQEAVQQIERTVLGSKGNKKAIDEAFNARKPLLQSILGNGNTHKAPVTPHIETGNEESGVPVLPAHVKANEARAHEASPTLDALIKFFQYWCTRSYEGYHEAVAIWVLSTIAARRVVLPWRKGVWTNLYIVLVSDSTVNAKTEAASYGQYVIEQCGLKFLLSPADITPQKFVSKMGGNVYSIPRNYSVMKDEDKKRLELKLAFSAQKGWVYDEFGDFLQEIIKGSGPTKQFYKLLKRLYDNKTEYEYETVTRGDEVAEMPYLSLLGTTPPDSLKPIANTDSAVWTDGAFARMAFIVSPDKKPRLQSAPDGEAIIPNEIRDALVHWHERLGVPNCEIIDLAEKEELQNEADKALGKKPEKRNKDLPAYDIERDPLPQNPVYWTGSGVREAHEQYYGALATLAYERRLSGAFKSTYGRLPGMALSIAMLLASLENNGYMDMRHWGRGQAIAERWREDFHELVKQLSNGNAGGYGALEEAVIEVLTAKIPRGQKANSRVISQKGSTLLRNAGSPTVRKVLNELFSQDAIAREGTGNAASLYGLKEEAK